MKILFVTDRRVNAGSIQAVANYVRAGDALGHTIAVYGSPAATFPGVRFSTDVGSFDQVVFLFESKLRWLSGLQLAYLLSQVPRQRRAILDADGMFNPVICVDSYDRNHGSERERENWLAYYDRLTDRVLQPTFAPLQEGVVGLPFYGYDPAAHVHSGMRGKQFDLLHVGHNWWRWREMRGRILPAIERIRSRLGEVCFIGLWWDAAPTWAGQLGLKDAFCTDAERLRQLGIQVRPPVPFSEVIAAMSAGRINLMTQRPLFRRLRFLTSKYFEIFCADTIPLVVLDPEHAERVYGPLGRELTLHDRIADKILDVLEHPLRYHEIVQEVRYHLAAHHSYPQRVRELVAALEA